MATRRWTETPVNVQRGARCHDCGYDLRGTAIGDRCPECGTIVPVPRATAAVDRGRPDHRESGLHVVATCQYLALIPMSGIALAGCAGPTLGVISVFGPVGRLVALRSRWRGSPLRDLESDGLGVLLERLALVETCLAIAYLATIIAPLPDVASLPVLLGYALMATISVSMTNFKLNRMFDGWQLRLPALLARLGFIAGCLAGVSTLTIVTVSLARPNPDIVGIVAIAGLAIGILTSMLAVFAARDGIGRVEVVLITDLIETHAEEAGREPTVPAGRRPRREHAEPLPLEPERPPIRRDLD